jgi:fumarate hydratase class II
MNDPDRRIEHDTFGPIAVPAARYWGAQTQRSLENFPIGAARMPVEVIHALARVKRAAAGYWLARGEMADNKARAIMQAAGEVVEGRLDEEFPLVVYQTGSGTQTNMNVNEVIANRAAELLGAARGAGGPVHPNDDVNRGQSSNDTFPTAMHAAVALSIRDLLLPALDVLSGALREKATAFADIVKIGRTHLQDATPLTLGQEFGGYAAQVEQARARIAGAINLLMPLAQGGTAVGTGLNAPGDFGAAIASALAEETGLPFRQAPDLFAALASHDDLLAVHGTLNAAAAALFKIANDIRLLGSGPRAGLGELILPENEPGSSIMPGKVNPTQSEALTMVCARVFGNHTTITFAASQGHLELNVFKPVIAGALLESVRLLADGADSFARRCVAGLSADTARIGDLVGRSLMLVTALAPVIGYDRAADIAKSAHKSGVSLRQAAIDSGFVTGVDFDRIVDPGPMTRPWRIS